MCRGIGSHFHPSGKWMTPSQTLILVNQWVVIFFKSLFSWNFRYMGPILGQNWTWTPEIFGSNLTLATISLLVSFISYNISQSVSLYNISLFYSIDMIDIRQCFILNTNVRSQTNHPLHLTTFVRGCCSLPIMFVYQINFKPLNIQSITLTKYDNRLISDINIYDTRLSIPGRVIFLLNNHPWTCCKLNLRI